MPSPRRHVWCELVPYRRLREPAVIRALAARGVQPIVAVMPHQRYELIDTVRALRDGGLSVGVWPMLDDDAGRWVNTRSAHEFLIFVTELITALHSRDALPDELAFDLEPSIAGVRALLDGHAPGLRPRAGSVAESSALLGALARELEAIGVRTSAAVLPFTMARSDRAARGWQRLLGTPIDALAVSRVSAMAYTSLFEGYSRGLVSRGDSLAFLDEVARTAHARHGPRASVSLGCVGTGALGDERMYRSPAELSEDVAIVTAAGVDDIALFNLAGALARGPLDAWLDALVAPAAPPPPIRRRLRTRALTGLVTTLGTLAGGRT